MRLAQARWPDLAVPRPGLLVLPLGSTEQHGPHLPLTTDTVIASAVADGLLAARPEADLLPPLALGASGEHAGFPGTVSIGAEAVRLLLVELVRDAAGTWPGVLVVNGHGGNATAIDAAAALCRHEGRRLAVVHCGLPGMDAHAGRAETSLLLHLAPELVALDRAAAGATEPLPALLPRLRAEGVAAVSPNGVLGDPAGAGASEGERLLAGLVDRAVTAYDAARAS